MSRLALATCVVDLEHRTIDRGGAILPLTPKEQAVLRYLADRQGRVVQLDALERDVWGIRGGAETRTVGTTIRRLRRKIERDPGAPDHLRTVRGVGFCLHLDTDPDPDAPPVCLTSFVGRADELDRLTALLDSEARLITLLGPPGIGKTRLAAELAARLHGAARPTLWVDATGGVDVWVARLARGCGLGAVPEGQLLATLRSRGSAPIVLDGVQVTDGLGDTLRRWLAGAPELRVMLTGTGRLGIAEEHVWTVEPLTPEDAAALFAARAQATHQDFSASEEEVGTLVDALDRLPMLIELAAGCCRILSVAQIISRLCTGRPLPLTGGGTVDQAFERLYDTSWRTLTDRQRDVLAQCSVFAGGFSLEDAEAVVTSTGAPAAAVILALVDRSWIQLSTLHDPPRTQLRLLDRVRGFVVARSPKRGAAQSRHAAHFAGASDWLPWHRCDALDDLQEALRIAQAEADPALVCRVGLALAVTWLERGSVARVVPLLEQIHNGELEPILLARWLGIRSRVSHTQGRLDEALHDVETASNLYRRAKAPAKVANCLLHQATLRMARGDFDALESLYEDALRWGEEAGETQLQIKALLYRGDWLARMGRNPEQAERDFDRALLLDPPPVPRVMLLAQRGRVRDKLGKPGGQEDLDSALEVAQLLPSLQIRQIVLDKRFGHWFDLGDYDRAIAEMEKSLAFAIQRGDRAGELAIRGQLGEALCMQGKLDEAEQHLVAAIGGGAIPRCRAAARVRLGAVAHARGQLAVAAAALRKGADEAVSLRQLACAVDGYSHLAVVQAGLGDPDGADEGLALAASHLEPEDPMRSMLWARAGLVKLERGEHNKACLLLERAREAIDTSRVFRNRTHERAVDELGRRLNLPLPPTDQQSTALQNAHPRRP